MDARMDGWLRELAETLGEDPLTGEEIRRLLDAARDVAHRVERKATPLATFLLGAAVGRAGAGGMTRDRAMDDVVARATRLLPAEEPRSTGEAAGEASRDPG